jgi:hypothetical protein
LTILLCAECRIIDSHEGQEAYSQKGSEKCPMKHHTRVFICKSIATGALAFTLATAALAQSETAIYSCTEQ